MPGDGFDMLKKYDAIHFDALGWPDAVPEHISLWDSLSQKKKIRKKTKLPTKALIPFILGANPSEKSCPAHDR
jgi:hypothetical protein